MIEIRNINKHFSENYVLKNVSFIFEAGKTNLIIGKSGSGKTVLLKSLVGLYKINSGEIFYNERNFCRIGNKRRRKILQEIGMLFQGSALFDSMTVEENIKSPLQMLTNFTPRKILQKVNFCLERVELIDINKLYPAEISGGMKKRVAIARAISLNPRYLLCDEPNSGLDPATAIVIDNLIQEITQEYKITTIINTHDMNSVLEIGDNILFLNEGEVCWKGTKNEIFNTRNDILNEFVFASDLYKKIIIVPKKIINIVF